MEKKKTIFLIFSLTILLWFIPVNFASASETNNNAAYYDLEVGGTQSFTLIDENHEEVIITVEEILPTSNVSLFAVSNGSYRISGTRSGIWEANYYITVSNNNITRAYSPSATALSGSFTSTSLKVDNTKQATYYLDWKLGMFTSKHYLRSNISNGSLIISY